MKRKQIIAGIALLAMVLTGAGAAASSPDADIGPIPPSVSAPRGVLPEMMHHAGHNAVVAYEAALEYPDVVAAVPCTCGCIESLGHTSNLDCYIEQVHRDGSATYSTHGLYCGVCQLITNDAVKVARAGMNATDLHSMIVEKYGSH